MISGQRLHSAAVCQVRSYNGFSVSAACDFDVAGRGLIGAAAAAGAGAGAGATSCERWLTCFAAIFFAGWAWLFLCAGGTAGAGATSGTSAEGCAGGALAGGSVAGVMLAATSGAAAGGAGTAEIAAGTGNDGGVHA